MRIVCVKVEVFCFPLALLTGNVDHSTDRQTDRPHSKEVEKASKQPRSHGVSLNRTKEQKPKLLFRSLRYLLVCNYMYYNCRRTQT
jgi:hypothetical protein